MLIISKAKKKRKEITLIVIEEDQLRKDTKHDEVRVE